MAKTKTDKKKEAPKEFKIDWMDADEVARGIFGIDEEAEPEVIEDALYKKYEISSENFHSILQDLFKHISIGISPLTEQAYIGLSKVDSRGFGTWMVKKPIESEFLTSVLHWLGAEKLKKDKSSAKEVRANGELEFTISVTKNR